MIKGMGKKTTQRVWVKRSTNALLQKVLGLCVEISTTTKADVFFEYMPHVDSFSLRVFLDGWEVDRPVSYTAECIDIAERDLLAMIAKLEAMREELRA